MKKVKVFSLTLLSLFLMFFSFVIFPVKVFASSSSYGTAEEWFNHISQFNGGVARGEITYDIFDDFFGLLIVEEPSHQLEGLIFEYANWKVYFKPTLATHFNIWWVDGENLLDMLESVYGENYDGCLYWNFEEKYWQVEYYDSSDFGNNNNNNKEVDMVTDLLDTLSEIGAGIGDLFGRIVESVGQFFYTPGTGDTPGSFTIVGILTIAAVVVSLSMWVLRLILRLFKLRG